MDLKIKLGPVVVLVFSVLNNLSAEGSIGRKQMRTDLNPVTFLKKPRHNPIVLVKEGKPQGYICVMKDLTGPLKTAVEELAETVELTTGARLPVLQKEIKKPALVIGDCPMAASNGLNGKKMPVEGFEIKTAEELVFVVGNDEPVAEGIISTGPVWGVIEFMERFVDVRWYWPKEHGGRSLNQKDELLVPPVHL
ncbi:MAG: hypothetical protein NC911_10200, partial [Candidatus Omnitrophica bacterium]|nr:hypothetical protein [Candidatus Omnitrophota bacterium]